MFRKFRKSTVQKRTLRAGAAQPQRMTLCTAAPPTKVQRSEIKFGGRAHVSNGHAYLRWDAAGLWAIQSSE